MTMRRQALRKLEARSVREAEGSGWGEQRKKRESEKRRMERWKEMKERTPVTMVRPGEGRRRDGRR